MTRKQKLLLIEAWTRASILAQSIDLPSNEFQKDKQQTLKEMAVDLVILFDKIINDEQEG